MNMVNDKKSRREFLRQMAASIAYGGSARMMAPLAMMGTALGSNNASGAPADYRALVCVYFSGGNDAWNLLVPTDSAGYGAYATARGGLALLQGSFLPVTPASGGQYGIHPSCPELKTLFSAGHLAAVANVGTLVRPTSVATYTNKSVPLPPQLFSHADQTRLWQLGGSNESVTSGWGGQFADKLNTLNTNSTFPMSISISGNNVFQTGNSVIQYPISTNGSTAIKGYSGTTNFAVARNQALTDLLAMTYTNPMQADYASGTQRAIGLNTQLSAALTGAPALTTVFPPNNSLASQLQMVARMIHVRSTLQVNRQIFFVNMGGFDLHSNLLNTQPGQFVQISQALNAFYSALGEMSETGNVTLFTMSEFARTLQSNGSGADHAWGSLQLVMGGAVNGNSIYGSYPTLALNGPQTLSRGQAVPTTSVDQLAATLGKWMGVSAADLNTIFPNLAFLGPADLGFLAA